MNKPTKWVKFTFLRDRGAECLLKKKSRGQIGKGKEKKGNEGRGKEENERE